MLNLSILLLEDILSRKQYFHSIRRIITIVSHFALRVIRSFSGSFLIHTPYRRQSNIAR